MNLQRRLIDGHRLSLEEIAYNIAFNDNTLLKREMSTSVLLISNGFQPSYEKGFANGIAENGIRAELISSDRTLATDLDKRIKINNLRGSQDSRRSVYAKAGNLMRYAFSLVKCIRSGKHDVVHLIGIFMVRSIAVGLIESLAYRLLARRFFMTVHNLLPHNQHTRFNKWIFRIIYRLPDRLVVHTEKMRDALIAQFGVPAHRIIIMQHGVDELPPRLKVPESSASLRVLLFGGLSRYKGTDLFFEALQHCQDLSIKVLMAGECRDMVYGHQIESLISALGTNHIVRWDKAFIPEEKVGGYFEAVDAVVLPYRHIDQSGVLFTAFRYGTPVMATDVGAFRSCLPAFAGMIVPEQTPQSLAHTLREFNSRKIEFDRARIRQHAQSLTWPLTVKPLINEYKTLCGLR